MMKRRAVGLPVVLLMVAIAAVSGYFLPRSDDFFAFRKNFQIFGSLYEEVVTDYVDPIDAERLMRSGIDAMMDRLDPYTTFLDEADQADLDILSRGRYGGVGLTMGLRDGKITVISPVEGASGFRQGVRTGDVVTHIEDRSTRDMSLGDVRNLLRGEPGTVVHLTVQREGFPEPIRFALKREQVRVRSVSFAGFVHDDTARGLGYIRLDRFSNDAPSDVRNHIGDMQRTGSLRGLILDMRGNPGGLLEAAVEITSLFVPSGSMVVTTRGRAAGSETTFRTQRPPVAPDLPLVILVDETSASASEIVAGTIQDMDRGVIVGAPTLGKGLVQVIRKLPYNTAVKLTTARYYIPSGRSIQSLDYSLQDGSAIQISDSLRRTFRTSGGRIVRDGRGIEPDRMVGAEGPSELERALERRAAFFFFANQYAARQSNIASDFTVTDELLKEFREWLSREGFEYRTAAEWTLATLEEELESMGYTTAQTPLEQVRSSIRSEKQEDFLRHDERIRERLRSEIVARFAGESDQVRASFAHDAPLREAVQLLEDSRAYRRVLSNRN